MRGFGILIASGVLSVGSFTDAFLVQPMNRHRNVELAQLFGSSNQKDSNEYPVESASQVALVSFALASAILFNPLPAMADGQTDKFKLPPIDFTDKSRCVLQSSSMGQANAARDKLYDLRQCSLSGASAPGFDLSGVIMTNTDVSKADFKEAYFSKGYLHGAYQQLLSLLSVV